MRPSGRRPQRAAECSRPLEVTQATGENLNTLSLHLRILTPGPARRVPEHPALKYGTGPRAKLLQSPPSDSAFGLCGEEPLGYGVADGGGQADLLPRRRLGDELHFDQLQERKQPLTDIRSEDSPDRNRPVAVVSRPHALDAPQRDGNGAYGNGKLNVQKLNALNSESATNAIAKADHPRRPVWTRIADRGSPKAQHTHARARARVGAHAASCMPRRHHS